VGDLEPTGPASLLESVLEESLAAGKSVIAVVGFEVLMTLSPLQSLCISEPKCPAFGIINARTQILDLEQGLYFFNDNLVYGNWTYNISLVK
jgi:hypothetical protein